MAFDMACRRGRIFSLDGMLPGGCEKGASGSDDAKENALTVKPADAGTLPRFETFESDFNKPTWN